MGLFVGMRFQKVPNPVEENCANQEPLRKRYCASALACSRMYTGGSRAQVSEPLPTNLIL